MKILVVLAFVSAVVAAPVEEVPVQFELKQVHDVDGSYSFTYATEDASRTEARTPEGSIRGAYSYVDSDGVLQKVQYVADDNGFQAYGTNLPVGSTVPVKETPEVLEATAQHFALVDEHVKKVELAEKLHQEFLRIHPELFPDETGHQVPHQVVHHVVVEPVVKKVFKLVPVKKVPVKKIPVHHELPVVKKIVKIIPVVKKVPVVHHVQEVPVVTKTVLVKKPIIRHEELHQGLPVAPEEDDEIKHAREAHLALVQKLTAEHLAAVAAAPKYIEE